jgi:hypothetical protein
MNCGPGWLASVRIDASVSRSQSGHCFHSGARLARRVVDHHLGQILRAPCPRDQTEQMQVVRRELLRRRERPVRPVRKTHRDALAKLGRGEQALRGERPEHDRGVATSYGDGEATRRRSGEPRARSARRESHNGAQHEAHDRGRSEQLGERDRERAGVADPLHLVAAVQRGSQEGQVGRERCAVVGLHPDVDRQPAGRDRGRGGEQPSRPLAESEARAEHCE